MSTGGIHKTPTTIGCTLRHFNANGDEGFVDSPQCDTKCIIATIYGPPTLPSHNGPLALPSYNYVTFCPPAITTELLVSQLSLTATTNHGITPVTDCIL